MKKLIVILLSLLALAVLTACDPRESPDIPVSAGGTSVSPVPGNLVPPEPIPDPTPESTAEPVGPTPEPTPDRSVEITVDDSLDYDRAPEDIEGIIYLSAEKWRENLFEGTGVEEYECTRLTLYDVADSSFCYSMHCRFLSEGEPAEELMAGNTVPDESREGWYRFSRQIRVERDGDLWEIAEVGTGGIRADS